MSENFYVNTVGAVPASKLSEAVSLGVTLCLAPSDWSKTIVSA